MKRVVVTGMGGISPLGQDWETVDARLRSRENAISVIGEWDRIEGLGTRLGGRVFDFEAPSHYTRKQTRTMGRVALMAVRASERALEDAGLLEDPCIRDGRMGVSYGSCTGSTDAILDLAALRSEGNTRRINATSYIRMMSHTCAVNIELFFELKGRVIPTSSACTSGSQGIGYAYEAIKHGYQEIMLAGGGEELCVSQAAVFDVMFATSRANDTPDKSPRPFDEARDGLVIGEGAGTLVLESLEHAQARGASIYAEVVGFGTNSDGAHVTQPSAATMQRAMELALESAQVDAQAVGYVNAHATATTVGDVAESRATQAVFGGQLPISSLKSYIGHTLGASGALEAAMTIRMMNQDWYAPTVNLAKVDERCGELDYIMGQGRRMSNEHVMSNNFAFGGINTSLVFRRWR